MKRPLGVVLISSFYIFGALILLFSFFLWDVHTVPIGIAERFGMPFMPERLMRVIVAIFTLVLIHGYLSMKRWGFWGMIIYSIIFGGISLTLSLSPDQQPFMGNTIWSIIVLIYTISVNKAFLHQETSEAHT